MKPLAFTFSGGLVALALCVGTPLYGQARPNGGGGGSEGHAVSRPDSGGGSSTSSGSTSGSWGGSSGGGSTSTGTYSGSGSGGHSVYRTDPSTRNEGRRGGSVGAAASSVGDPGQRAVPRGARFNENGNPSSATARLRNSGDYPPNPGGRYDGTYLWQTNPYYGYGDGYWAGYRYGVGWGYLGGPWGYWDFYRGYWGPGWSLYGYGYDPFWWGLNYYGPPSTYGRDNYYGVDSRYPGTWGSYGGAYGGVSGGESEYRRDPQTTPGPKGGLKLKVEPKNAEVYVDGYFMGVVDDFNGAFQYLTLPIGAHRIEVKAKGYQPLAFDARIEQRDIVTYKGELQPEK